MARMSRNPEGRLARSVTKSSYLAFKLLTLRDIRLKLELEIFFVNSVMEREVQLFSVTAGSLLSKELKEYISSFESG